MPPGAVRRWQTVGLAVLLATTAPVSLGSGRCASAQQPSAATAGGMLGLPREDLFRPLLADPKETHSHATYLNAVSPARRTRVGAVAFGDNFGIVRWGRGGRDGVQVNLAGAVFAQFDLRTPSYDLMNADYVIGIPVTYRRGGFSARSRLYHQSSHLGDEHLLASQPERVNLQWESVELIAAQELRTWRAYAGGEYLFHREPANLGASAVRGGVEYKGLRPVVTVGQFGDGDLVVGLDVRSAEANAWRPSWSVRSGVEFTQRQDVMHLGRRWSVLAEYHDGPSPYGQFYSYDVTSYGVGLHIF